jgi:hypothetical protein
MKYHLMLLLCLVGCASRKSGWENNTEAVSMSSTEMTSVKSEATVLWRGRAEQAKLEKALEKFLQLHLANPNDLEALVYLTRGNYFLADSHLQETEQKKKIYELAASYGEKAMATNPAFKKLVTDGKSIEDSLDSLTLVEVPAMYWTAASLGKWSKISGIASQLKYKTRIKAMVSRVEKLSPEFFFGAPSRYWGGFYALAPSFAGGDIKKSKVQFDKSLKIAPEYQGTKVLMADVYFTKTGDKKAFEAALKEVLASKFDDHAEIGPENSLEKKKAEKLLAQIGELF